MENFEKIFKEKLEKHNGKVRAGAWAGISAGAAGKVATGSGIFSGGAMTYVASIAAGAILAVSGISIWNYNTEDNIPSQNEVVSAGCGRGEEAFGDDIVDFSLCGDRAKS